MEHSFAKIKTFVSVVELGSIKAASEKLDLDPSTVSRQLSTLESELGLLLVRRSSRKLSITRIGNRIFEHYKAALNELKHVEEACLGADLQNDIYLTMPASFGNFSVMPLVQEYIATHPHTRIHVDWSDEQRDLILDNIDIGIRGGHLQNDNMVAVKLSELNLSFVASPKVLMRHNSPSTFQDLVHLPWIKINSPGKTRLPPLKDGYALNTELITNIPLTVNSQDAAIEAVTRGLGIAVVERIALARQIKSGELVELFPGSILPMGYYWLYKPEGRWIQPHVREFSQYLIDHLRIIEPTTEKILNY